MPMTMVEVPVFSWFVSRSPFSRISAHVQEAKKREVKGSEYEVNAPKKERKRRNVGGGGRNMKEMHKKEKEIRRTWEAMVRI